MPNHVVTALKDQRFAVSRKSFTLALSCASLLPSHRVRWALCHHWPLNQNWTKKACDVALRRGHGWKSILAYCSTRSAGSSCSNDMEQEGWIYCHLRDCPSSVAVSVCKHRKGMGFGSIL